MGIRLDSDHFDTTTSLDEWMDERRETVAANLVRLGAADLVAMICGGDR